MKYTIVYKVADSYDDEIRFYELTGIYQLWVKICLVEHNFDYYNKLEGDMFFVDYGGYIWDCTDVKRLRELKKFLIKELKI